MNTQPIADLHCDLLCYLAKGGGRSPYDLGVRCAIPQLEKGSVKLQVLPIFSETHADSVKEGLAQAQVFKSLTAQYPQFFGEKVDILLSIENASSLSLEHEPLTKLFERWEALGVLPVYVSLTWNTENRFGGGAHTTIGLKSDGKVFLEYLHNKNVAIDLSHTSDHLAYDILNYIDAKDLQIPVLASHSNARAVTDVARNLPDELIVEIVRRDGIIGMNFVRYFVGRESPLYFVKQAEHLLSLGAAKHLCFGADFFFGDDVSPAFRKPPEETFFPEYGDSSTYGKVMELWRQHLKLSDEQLEAIAWGNLSGYLKKDKRDERDEKKSQLTVSSKVGL